MAPTRGLAYSAEQRAACLSLLITGQTVASVAAQSGVSVRTLINWKAAAHATPVATVEQKVEIGVLLVENLRLGLAATANIQRLFADEEYIRQYGPGELAVTFGILSDKMIRIIEAYSPPSEE